MGSLRGHRILRALFAALMLANAHTGALGQEEIEFSPELPERYLKSGSEFLEAFAPISAATRFSVAKLDVDGDTVALATVVDTNGLAVTKASELREGKLTSWVAGGREVRVDRIAIDDENDVALVRVHAEGLKPITWASTGVEAGQWVVTVGIEETPHAAGVVSAAPRKIPHPRAIIGVSLDPESSRAVIDRVLSGLGADKAGLERGDIVHAVNGEEVKSAEELIAALRNYRDGQSVLLRVQRGDDQFEVPVQLQAETVDPIFRGFDRQGRMDRMGGDLSRRAEGFERAIQHDTVLPPWLCGGPLVNLQGEAVGMNIARAGRVASYALPADLMQNLIRRLLQQAEAAVRPES